MQLLIAVYNRNGKTIFFSKSLRYFLTNVNYCLVIVDDDF